MQLNQNLMYEANADDWWENVSIYWRGSYTLGDYDQEIIFKRLKSKFVRVLNINEEVIKENLNLQIQLSLDPLEITFLISVLECEYGLERSEKLACQIDTIADILVYCEQTWPSKSEESWFPDPFLPEPEPKTRFRRVLKYLNRLQAIKEMTTFLRNLFKTSDNPLRKYIIQGRRRWVEIEKKGIHPSDEILDTKWDNWELWTKQDWIDWYGVKWKYHVKN
jgi:acyl carrier protein